MSECINKACCYAIFFWLCGPSLSLAQENGGALDSSRRVNIELVASRLKIEALNTLDESLLMYWLQLDDVATDALLDDEMPLLVPANSVKIDADVKQKINGEGNDNT